MKTLFPLMISISSVVLATQAQLAPVAPSHTGRVAGDYSILSRSAHERTWGKVVTVPLPSGETLLTTNSTYIEMATGLCFQDAQTQEWKDSQALIVPAPGGAISDQGQHKLFLPKNLGDGPIEVEMPSGQRLAAFPRFLAYADKDGKSVLIGTITNGEGKIISPTEVLYEDVCPEDIKGVAIRVCNHLWGYEADVLFTEQFPPAPEACGLSSQPGECGLQVWTEFVTAEPPSVSYSTISTPVAQVPDARIDFHSMQIGAGKAFSLGAAEGAVEIPVVKELAIIKTAEGDRQFLIEQVGASDFFKLATLPRREGAALSRPVERARFLATALPRVRTPQTSRSAARPMELASARTPRSGVLLDYVLLNSTQSNYVFAATSTYLVTQTANLNGVTRLEGSATIKLTNSSSVKILLNGPLVSTAGPYSMGLFTSRNDDSEGTSIPGSSGVPSSTNAATYLEAAAAQTNAYQWLRFSYAGKAIRGANLTNGVWHSQFINCGTAVESTGSDPVRLRNVLIAQCTNGVVTTGSFSGEQLTVDQCATLLSGGGSSGTLTNSLLTAVGTLGNVSLDNSPQFSSGTGLYQTVAAGSYYLGSWTNICNTNINPALRQDLCRLTTYPPIQLPGTINSALVLSPQAQRGTGPLLPGYFYAPLDYLASNVVLKASLTLGSGVAVGTCGTYGFALQLGPLSYDDQQDSPGMMGTLGMGGDGVLLSEGTPLAMNVFTRARNVQEQALSLGGATLFQATNNSPQLGLRFTQVSLAQGVTGTFMEAYPPTQCFSNLFVRDCQWRGVYLLVVSSSDLDPGNPISATLTNNLLERCSFDFGHGYRGGTQNTNNLQVILRNNLFRQVALSLYYSLAPVNPGWQVQDNLFDLCGLTFVADYGSNYVTRSYNGFTTNTVNAFGGASNKINLLSDYQSGPLGDYYYPTNGGSYSLTNLINSGSTWATNVGLYHFTTTTNQVKEAGTKVDIGFHLVALGTNGLPVSTSGDGLGDYLKDSNGNGVYDSADMGNWKTNDTCGDGLNDYIKYWQGRNLRVKTTNDPNNLIQLNVYTPLK